LDLGLVELIGFVGQEGWLIETLAGNPEEAERIARASVESLDRAGVKGMRVLASDELARSLFELGRLEEAEELTRESRDVGMKADDPFQAAWNLTLGRVLAGQGDLEEGERLVREGIGLLEPTQFLTDRAFSMLDLAEVLRMTGRIDEARSALEVAIGLFEQKGNVLSADRARRLLADLDP
jgi:tetratricopeptide (TPR) repeat protein